MGIATKSIRTIGLTATANIFGAIVGLIGALAQSRFVDPRDLGFLRKYSIISGYAVFLSLGLLIVLQREYPLLKGRGEEKKAIRVASIVHSWCLLLTIIICGGLILVTIIELILGRYREASGWLIQSIGVWSAIYVGALGSLFRSGQDFERLAKSQVRTSMVTCVVIPGFWWSAFPTMVIRSVLGPMTFGYQLYKARPLKLSWCLPVNELLVLVQSGIRLYIGDYLRYVFWGTIEIWLILWIAGEKGVGMLVFCKIIIDVMIQLQTAINQVYLPRIAHRYGECGDIRKALRVAVLPSIINIGIASIIVSFSWYVSPAVITIFFPKYLAAIPLLNIMVLQTVFTSFGLFLYMITILDGYGAQLCAAILGIAVFVGVTFQLKAVGLGIRSVGIGTISGQMTFAAVCFLWLGIKAFKKDSYIKREIC